MSHLEWGGKITAPPSGLLPHSSGCRGREGVEPTLSIWVNFGLKTNIFSTLGVSVQPLPWDLRLWDISSTRPSCSSAGYKYFCAPQGWGFSLHLFHRFFESSLGKVTEFNHHLTTFTTKPRSQVPRASNPSRIVTLPLPWTACSYHPVKNSFLNFIFASPAWGHFLWFLSASVFFFSSGFETSQFGSWLCKNKLCFCIVPCEGWLIAQGSYLLLHCYFP